MSTRHSILCTPVRLPDDLLVPAADEAIRENPVNRPADVTDPARLALLTTKYWGAKGVELAVAFMEQTPSDLAERIVAHMNAWRDEAGASVSFRLTGQVASAVVRVTRGVGGYWSYLGTDVKLIPQAEPTMCLQGFTMRTAESEFRRVVRHEAGHTLGFVHEHLRRELVAKLDPTKTLAYFRRTQGWTEADTRAQVLTPIEDASLLDPTRVDGVSIMAYQLPGAITRDGLDIPGGADLDELDKGYAAKVYPRASQPPVAPKSGVAIIIMLDRDGKELDRFTK